MSDAALEFDPRNLIREAFRIEGITLADCRSVFLDWALGLKDHQEPRVAAAALLAHYSDEPGDHPMRVVLTEARDRPPPARRRSGGAMGRRGGSVS